MSKVHRFHSDGRGGLMRIRPEMLAFAPIPCGEMLFVDELPAPEMLGRCSVEIAGDDQVLSFGVIGSGSARGVAEFVLAAIEEKAARVRARIAAGGRVDGQMMRIVGHVCERMNQRK